VSEEALDGAADRYPHLDPWVATVADRSDEARFQYLKADRFIPYEAARVVFAELEDILTWPNTVRPPCRFLVAESDMGKSAIFKEFQKDHPASDNLDGDFATIPVMRMQFPETGSDGVYGEVIRKLNAETSSNPTPRALRSQALSLLDAIGNRVLIIDEIANVMVKDATRKTIAMNAIKFIANELERPIVMGVTPEAFTAVIVDKHIKSRFEPIFLPRFKDNEHYREFLFGFELALPLRKPSGLATNNDIAFEILQRTLGLAGSISKLTVAAARAAIRSGEERITVDIIQNVVWMDSATVKKKLDDL
jgi:hypothetical protein